MAGARRFEDLIAWQLSEQAKEMVFRLTSKGPVVRDLEFCEEIRQSARSVPANIAEGFGWYEPRPNARHVSIAKASLDETRNHTLDGFKRNYFDRAERDELLNLLKRARVATTRLLRYLRSCKNAPPGKPYTPKSQGSAEPKHPKHPRNPRNPEPEP